MPYLVKKINLAFWADGVNVPYSGTDSISADAITCDVKTGNNELSVWKIDDLNEIDLVSISMVSIMDYKSSKINLVALPYDEINEKLILGNTPRHGKTAIIDFENRHYDIQSLNYKSIGVLGHIMAKTISEVNKVHVRTYDVKKLLVGLKRMCDDHKINVNKLGEYVKEELGLSK